MEKSQILPIFTELTPSELASISGGRTTIICGGGGGGGAIAGKPGKPGKSGSCKLSKADKRAISKVLAELENVLADLF